MLSREPQAQAAAQEARQADAHFAGARAVLGGQGGDGVQAVEQEMRVDLHAQRLQLGLAGQGAGFGGAALGLAPGLRGQGRVVQADGKQVEQHAHAEPGGQVGRQAPPDPLESDALPQRRMATQAVPANIRPPASAAAPKAPARPDTPARLKGRERHT